MSDSPNARHAMPDTGPQPAPAVDGDTTELAAARDSDLDAEAEREPHADAEPASDTEAEPDKVSAASPAEPPAEPPDVQSTTMTEPPDVPTTTVTEPPDVQSTTVTEPVGSRAWSAAPTAVLPASPHTGAETVSTAPPAGSEQTTEQPTPPAPPPPPALRTEGLGVTVHGRRVFAGFDVVLDPHSVLIVAAPSGTGRSTLLLTLTGRFAATAGRLEVAGATDPAQIRRLTAVARIASFAVPEPRLTVGEAITERALIEGVGTAAGDAAVTQAATVLGLQLDRDRLVEDLPADKRTLLAAALACSRPAELIVLDDLDDRLDIAGQARVLDRLGGLAAEGPAIVVTTTQPLRLPSWASGVTLLTAAVSAPSPPEAATDATATTASTEGPHR